MFTLILGYFLLNASIICSSYFPAVSSTGAKFGKFHHVISTCSSAGVEVVAAGFSSAGLAGSLAVPHPTNVVRDTAKVYNNAKAFFINLSPLE